MLAVKQTGEEDFMYNALARIAMLFETNIECIVIEVN